MKKWIIGLIAIVAAGILVLTLYVVSENKDAAAAENSAPTAVENASAASAENAADSTENTAAVSAEAADEASAEADDADADAASADFARKNFQTLYSDGQLSAASALTFDTETSEDGIVVSGDSSILSAAKIDLETVDFGTETLQRIQLNAIGEAGASTIVKLYLDGSDEATAEFTLPTQAAEGDWSGNKNVNVDVSELCITGAHTVELAVFQYNIDGSPKDSGTATVFFKSIQFVKQSLPVVYVEIDESQGTISAMNEDKTHATKCYGNITVSVPEAYTDKYGSSYAGGTYELDYIKGRGNSTWEQEKKPYKIKLESSANLFGMGENASWALVADYCDDALIRNGITYTMGEDLGYAFTPQGVYVDVVMNGDYLGNYLLCEYIKVDEQRVDIDPDTEFLLSTGTWGADEDAYSFTTTNGETFILDSPDDSTDNFAEKCEDITAYIQRVENALMRNPDPETGEVEDPFDLIDIHSAAAYYLIQELSNNGDFFDTGSTYCYRLNDGKLYWGPLWDFDIAYEYKMSMEDFFSTEDPTTRWNERVRWFKLMLTFPEFTEELKTYWNEKLYPELQTVLEDGGMIDQYTEQLAYSAANNFSNADYETFYHENADESEQDQDFSLCRTTEEAEQRFRDETARLKSELKTRTEWCNENLDTIAVDTAIVTFVSEGRTIATTNVYGGRYVQNMPEDPVCSDTNKVFSGWCVEAADEDGSTYMKQFTFDDYSNILNYCQEKGGKYYVTLTAQFTDQSAS